MKGMTCKTCGKPLCKGNVKGWCRTHYAAANISERSREQSRARWSDPAYRAARTPELAAYSRLRLDWCPLEYRDDYRRLTRLKRYSAAQARKLIEVQIAADLAKYQRTGALPQSQRVAA